MPRLIFFLVLAVTFIIKVQVLQNKELLTHDESISILSYTATEGSYNKLIENESFVAGDVQELIFKEDVSFMDVCYDMSNYDIHPPLYFYLGGLLRTMLQVDPVKMVYINLIFYLIALFFFYKLARLFLNDSDAFLASMIWILSPALFENSFEMRHYSLFEAIIMIYLFIFYQWFKKDPDSIKPLLLLAVVFFAGLLTHYHIVLLPVALGVALLMKKKFRQFLIITILHLLMLGAVIMIIPDYLQPFLSKVGLGQTGADTDTMSDIIRNIALFTLFTLQFVTETRYLLVLIVLLILAYAFFKRKDLIHFTKENLLFVVPLTTLIVISAALYAVGMTPQQALGHEYLCYVWGLLSIALVLALRNIKVALYLCILVMAYSSLTGVYSEPRYVKRLDEDLKEKLGTADVIHVKTFERGFIPRMTLYLKPECKILIDQEADKEGYIWSMKIGDGENKIAELHHLRIIY